MQRMLRFAVAALLLLPLVHASAQTGTSGEEILKKSETAPNRGFFGEARRGDQKISLLGTVPAGRADFSPPNIDYIRRFNETAGIVLEANVFDAKRVGEAVQKTALYP